MWEGKEQKRTCQKSVWRTKWNATKTCKIDSNKKKEQEKRANKKKKRKKNKEDKKEMEEPEPRKTNWEINQYTANNASMAWEGSSIAGKASSNHIY
jgi:hypothetical protein